MSRVIDERQRILALSPIRSLAVTAPAGSGKTELLTRRVLTLLASVEQPEQILAITFTRKAASEMRQRILAALQMANQEAPQEPKQRTLWEIACRAMEQNRQKGWQLLENPNRLRLQTIDSFCMSLVRQMPLLSGMGSDLAISDKPELLYEKAVGQLFAQLKESGPGLSDLKRLIAHLDNNMLRIESLLCGILGKREQWLRHLVGNRSDLSGFKAHLESNLRCLVDETLSRIPEYLANMDSQLLHALKFAASNLEPEKQAIAPDATALPGFTTDALSAWQSIVALLMTKSGEWRARLTKNEGFPPGTAANKKDFADEKSYALTLIQQMAEHSDLKALFLQIRDLPPPYYDDRQWQLLGCLSNLLPLLVAELMLIFRESGEVDYPQITIAALEALGHSDAPSDITLLLDYRLQHILVDEFQDTSSAQFALLSHLTESWQPDDGKSFFIVGDGMQSCYGFRDANVGLFLAARDFGIGNAQLEPLELEVNFRSQRGIVDWVNQTFIKAFPENDDIARGAVKYASSSSFKDEPTTDAVAFYACVDDSERSLETEQVIKLAREFQAQAPKDSIAILVRNRTHLELITQRLSAEGIHWSGVDLEPLTQKAIIQDLLSLTKAVLNPSDRVAWLSVLRAPWCGLSLKDLDRVAGIGASQLPVWHRIVNDETIQSLELQGQRSIKHLRSVLQAALMQRARKPLRQWIEGIWLALGGPATADSRHDLKQASVFFELLEQHEAGGIIADMEQFNKAVEEIYAQPEESPDAIQIMTIHKAKGLEFDRVIVPGLDRSGRTQGNELLLQHERLSEMGHPQLLISPISATGQDEDCLYRYLKQEKKVKVSLENTRLIYVAATRAVKQLALIACLNQHPESNRFIAPAAASLLYCLWSGIEEQAILVQANRQISEPNKIQANDSPFQLWRFSDKWEPPVLPESNLLRAYRGHEYHQSENSLPLSDHCESLEQVTQQLLYAIAQQGVDRVRERQSKLPLVVKRFLSNMDKAGDEPTQLALLATLDTILTDPQGRWILSAGHQDILTNRQVFVQDNNRRHKLTLPHCFVSEGERWVIEVDLTDCEPASIEADCVARMDRYHKGLKQFEQRPIKRAVYFPLLKKLALL